MEELLTTVLLLSFNFALDIRDGLTHQTNAAAYYEVENSNNVTEVTPHLRSNSIHKGHLTEKRVSYRSSLAYSRGRPIYHVKS